MTDRTAAETVEAVAEFLENDKEMLPDHLTAPQAYAWAIFKVRTVALAFRLSQSAKHKEPPPPPDDVGGIREIGGFR